MQKGAWEEGILARNIYVGCAQVEQTLIVLHCIKNNGLPERLCSFIITITSPMNND